MAPGDSWRFPEIPSYSRDTSSTGQKFSLLVLIVFCLAGWGGGSSGSGSSGMLEPELDADSTAITGVWKLQGSGGRIRLDFSFFFTSSPSSSPLPPPEAGVRAMRIWRRRLERSQRCLAFGILG